MKVYVAMGSVDYEGDNVVGVYATREEAIERCQLIAEAEEREREHYYNSYSMSVWEIGGYMPDRSQAWSWRPDVQP